MMGRTAMSAGHVTGAWSLGTTFHTEAHRIEEVLAGHGIAARVGRASISTEAIRFPLQLGLGATSRRLLGLSERIAREAGYSRVGLRREGRSLFLELPRAEGAGLRYGDLLEIAGRPPVGSALLGLVDGGRSLALPLEGPTGGHLLVSGHEGVGKSALLRLIALGMASHHPARAWRLALLDCAPDRPAAPLRALPHCWNYSDRPEHAVGWLARLTTELRARDEGARAAPRVLVLIDRIEPLLEVGGEVARWMLQGLLDRGAAVGLHLVAATRDPAALGALVGRFPTRIEAVTGSGAGRFALRSGEQPIPLQVARLDRCEAEEVISRIRGSKPRLVARAPEVAS